MDNINNPQMPEEHEEMVSYLSRITMITRNSWLSVRYYALNGYRRIYSLFDRYCLQQPRKIKYSMLLGALFILAIVLTVSLIGHSKKSEKTSGYVVNTPIVEEATQQNIASGSSDQTDSLKAQLASIKQNLSQSSLSQEKLAELENQMQSLSSSMDTLVDKTQAAQSAAQQAAQISSENAETAKAQVAHVDEQLQTIKKAVVLPTYLPVSTLPFQVAGIDFWNGKPMVSIAMKDVNGGTQYRLMGQGMAFDCQTTTDENACTRWTLRTINTSPDTVIFVNPHGGQVKVVV